jgi:hypothetical protein
MTQEQLFVKMAVSGWESTIKRVNTLLAALSNEQLEQEIAPGRNRGIYLLGHLTAINDAMPVILGLGERLYPQLDTAFLTSPDKSGQEMPPAATLRQYWAETNNRLADYFSKVPAAEWFHPHTQVSAEDFAKEPHRNKLNVLMGRTNHLSYHYGQLTLLKK